MVAPSSGLISTGAAYDAAVGGGGSGVLVGAGTGVFVGGGTGVFVGGGTGVLVGGGTGVFVGGGSGVDVGCGVAVAVGGRVGTGDVAWTVTSVLVAVDVGEGGVAVSVGSLVARAVERVELEERVAGRSSTGVRLGAGTLAVASSSG